MDNDDSNVRLPRVPKIAVPTPVVAPPKPLIMSGGGVQLRKSTALPNQQQKPPPQTTRRGSGPKSRAKTASNVFMPPPMPKLCPACSSAIVSYLIPLQKYITDIVQVAAGHADPDALPDGFVLGLPPSANPRRGSQPQQQRQDQGDQQPQQQNQDYETENESSGYDSNWQHDEGEQNGGYDQNNQQQETREEPPAQQSHVYQGNQYWHNEQPKNQDNQHQEQPPQQHYNQDSNNNQQWHQPQEQQHHQEQHHQPPPQQHWQPEVPRHGQLQSIPENYQPPPPQQHYEQNQHYEPPPPPPHQEYHAPPQEQHHYQEPPRQEYHQSPAPVPPPQEPPQPSEYHQEIEFRPPEAHAYDEFYTSFGDNSLESPYAIVTIAYNNLTAINAIILANSLILHANRTVVAHGKSYRVSFICLTSGYIDPNLRNALGMVFDTVENVKQDYRIRLLYDRTLGSSSQQIKTQLWRCTTKYQKCIFMEHFTMAVGKVTDLFIEAEEFSACVDSSCPDLFNCSLFVFKPSGETYDQLVKYTVQEQEKAFGDGVVSESDVIDEPTVLNGFFASRWNRLSFIYNFTPSQSVYTQTPAFLKFGGQVRVVNFGQMAMLNYSAADGTALAGAEPWHVAFDLIESETYDKVKTSGRVAAFYRFYLDIFMKRLWPLLRHYLTPLMRSHYGSSRRYWSVYEIALVMLRELDREMDDYLFQNNVLSFHRLKSPVEKLGQYRDLERDIARREAEEAEQERLRQIEFQRAHLAAQAARLKEQALIDQESEQEEDLVIKQEPADDEEVTEPKVEAEGAEGVDSAAATAEVKQETDTKQSDWDQNSFDWMGAHNSDRIMARIRHQIMRK